MVHHGRVRARLEPVLRVLSATILLGAATGAVIGGIGGRLAMRVLFLTSDDAVKGITSDDGFEIGRFSLSDTLGLVAFAAILGVLAALAYQVARPFVAPRLGRAEVPVMAVFFGVVGGALLVHRDGVDFTVLEPVGLAIALFVLLSAAFGAAASWLLRRAAATGWPDRWGWRRLGPPLVVLAFPPILVAALLAAAARWATDSADPAAPAWRLVRAGAFGVMAAGFAVAAVKLGRDTAFLT
jgi:hypothetical protein